MRYDEMTGGWFPHAPYLRDQELIISDVTDWKIDLTDDDLDELTAQIAKYFSQVVSRAFMAGKKKAKEELRQAIFD